MFHVMLHSVRFSCTVALCLSAAMDAFEVGCFFFVVVPSLDSACRLTSSGPPSAGWAGCSLLLRSCPLPAPRCRSGRDFDSLSYQAGGCLSLFWGPPACRPGLAGCRPYFCFRPWCVLVVAHSARQVEVSPPSVPLLEDTEDRLHTLSGLAFSFCLHGIASCSFMPAAPFKYSSFQPQLLAYLAAMSGGQASFPSAPGSQTSFPPPSGTSTTRPGPTAAQALRALLGHSDEAITPALAALRASELARLHDLVGSAVFSLRSVRTATRGRTLGTLSVWTLPRPMGRQPCRATHLPSQSPSPMTRCPCGEIRFRLCPRGAPTGVRGRLTKAG